MNTIYFKGLGLEFNIDRVAFQFFNLTVYWYGIIISLAFLTGLFVMLYFARSQNYDRESLLDMVIITTPIAVIGARLYYVIFRYDEYKNNFGEALRVWHGGLAIYGAIIFSLITVIVLCKIKKLDTWGILDVAAPGFIIAQSIGRWGNFVNVEAYGRETSIPWAMTIIENGVLKSVHPTFLYESLWNLSVFIFLCWFFKKRKNTGEIFTLYIGLYSLGRIFIENLRVDSLYIGSFRISQLVALIFIICAYYVFLHRRKSRNI